ncbi:hypothetical protein Q5H92_17910 [Hymenobacter sp. M29]|uniref:RiboL-PSP-HEPN domain-containing protein n=1 Tax=Hymenobacter mellowenesis TaxID=3063995 RepID=A0ABT9AEH9_9BACT|nr:hypothetical protein [Hymenobacter sp. M29]MDO7848248.1 hypothetical protein [Hymenobacter sp. M29]
MESSTLTIGQIIDALSIEIFDKNTKDSFLQRCIQRENGIKQYIDICGVIMSQLIDKPGLTYKELSYWKKAKVKECMHNLVEYTAELVGELDKEKIEAYCKKITGPFSFLQDGAFMPDFTLLMLNSYYGAIYTDVYWIADLTVYEVMEISGGKFNLDELGKKTPDKIDHIKSILLTNSKVFENYKPHIDSVNEAISCYDKKFSKAFNLLLLTGIEGLTRALGRYLVNKQGLEIDSDSDDYNSLDSFLRKIPWKEELKISKTRLSLLTNSYKRVNYNDPLVVRGNPFESVSINLKVRLDFLRRRFKENRDLILHGQETEYNKSYNGFINLSALLEVLETIIECHLIHDKD